MKKIIKSLIKIIENIMAVIGVILIAWLIISYFNIIFTNRTIPGTVDRIWDYNLFKIYLMLTGN